MQQSIRASVELEWEATLGEGPVWDEHGGELYWIDILSGKLYRYDPLTHINIVYEIGEHLGAVALRRQGGLVMAMQSGFAFFDPDTKNITKITDPESHLPQNRFNDGKCDPSGRFWAGTLSYHEEQGAGSLYCLDGELNVDLKLQDLTISNGMAWNKERTKFYFIDTPTHNIMAYDYDDESGKIAKPTTIKKIIKKKEHPDGMTIDREGALWVALYNGGKVIRIDPINGEILFEVNLPVPQATSCTFGGADFHELYITTGREHMSTEEVEKWPLSGSLFKAEVPFKGRPISRFDG